MTFESGRTRPQDGLPCVIEGSRIYVSPGTFLRVQEAGACPDLSLYPDVAAVERSDRMMRAAGLTDQDMRMLRYVQRIDVVVDREMTD